jgi:phage shock protein E
MSENYMTLEDFYNIHHQLDENSIILDVRRAEEFAESHIAQARNIPLDQLADHIAEIKKFKKVYIHCKKGGRAKSAYQTLKQAGLNNMICIADAGMDQWLEKGYPINS